MRTMIAPFVYLISLASIACLNAVELSAIGDVRAINVGHSSANASQVDFGRSKEHIAAEESSHHKRAYLREEVASYLDKAGKTDAPVIVQVAGSSSNSRKIATAATSGSIGAGTCHDLQSIGVVVADTCEDVETESRPRSCFCETIDGFGDSRLIPVRDCTAGAALPHQAAKCVKCCTKKYAVGVGFYIPLTMSIVGCAIMAWSFKRVPNIADIEKELMDDRVKYEQQKSKERCSATSVAT